MSGQQEFAALLRQAVREAERRLNRGIDRSQLARKLHVSPQSLYAYLSGATVPSASTLTALLAELEASAQRRELLAKERDRLIESRRKPRHPKPRHPIPAEPPVAIPQQLPPAVSGFVGRRDELAMLTRLQAGGDALALICGTAGVGKTALAVHWAHQMAEPFPDGSLFLDLRGHDPDRPVAVAEALGVFLRALGVNGAGLPPGETERAALYRTLLASRNMLIVLDNAATVAQVRPLLPGTGANMVVVTSRNLLSGLVARDGAKRLVVDLLSVPEAAGLIQSLTEHRSISRPQAEELARRCARLPLALRVAAELVLAHPGAPVDELISGLGDEVRRLDLLAALGDDRTDARSVFSWSYRHLPETAARAFRLMGLPQGGAVDAYACAALLDSDLAEAVSAIDQLTQAHLVTLTAGGTAHGLVTMHDLLRAYAAELAHAVDPAPEREAALRRLLDHYRFCASLAVPQVSPVDAARMPVLAAPRTPLPRLADRHTAHAWLDLHSAILLRLTRQAAQSGLSRHAVDVAVILNRYFIVRADYPQAVFAGEHGLRAARQLGDGTGETTLLLDLGAVHARWCRYDEAISYLERGLSLARTHGHRVLQTRALAGLGSLHWSVKGEYGRAAEYLEQALLLAREVADEVLEGKICGELGVVYQRTGRYREALPRMRLALELQRRHGDGVADPVVMANLGFALVEIGQERDGIPYLANALLRLREAGNRVGEGSAQLNLGIAHLRLGEIGQARRFLLRGLRVNRQAGERMQEAHGLDQLGRLLSREGKHDKALAHHQRALAIYAGLGNRSREAFARTGFGLSLIAAGRVDDALRQLGKALAWSSGTQEPMQEAAAHDGLGQAYLAAGDGERACRHWRQALEIYVRLELPAATEVRRQLESLGQRAA